MIERLGSLLTQIVQKIQHNTKRSMFALRPLGVASNPTAPPIFLDPSVSRFIIGRSGVTQVPTSDGAIVHIQKLNLGIPASLEDITVSRKQAELIRGDDGSLSLKCLGANGIGLICTGQSRVLLSQGQTSALAMGDQVLLNGFKLELDVEHLLVFELVPSEPVPPSTPPEATTQTITAEANEAELAVAQESVSKAEEALAAALAHVASVEAEKARLVEETKVANARAASVQAEFASLQASVAEEKQQRGDSLEADLTARAYAAMTAGMASTATTESLRGSVEEVDDVVGSVRDAHAAALTRLAAQRKGLAAKAHAAAEASKEPRLRERGRILTTLREAFAGAGAAPAGGGLAAVATAVKAELTRITAGCGVNDDTDDDQGSVSVSLSALVELLRNRLADVTSAKRFVVCDRSQGPAGAGAGASTACCYHTTKRIGDLARGLDPVEPGTEVVPAGIESEAGTVEGLDGFMADDDGGGGASVEWLRVESVLGRGALYLPLLDSSSGTALLRRVNGADGAGDDQSDAAAGGGGDQAVACHLDLTRAAVAVVEAWISLASDLSETPGAARALSALDASTAPHSDGDDRHEKGAAAVAPGVAAGALCLRIPLAVWTGLDAARDLLTPWPSGVMTSLLFRHTIVSLDGKSCISGGGSSSSGPALSLLPPKEHPLASTARLGKLEREGRFSELSSLALSLGDSWIQVKAAVLLGDLRGAAILAHRLSTATTATCAATVAASTTPTSSKPGKDGSQPAEEDSPPNTAPYTTPGGGRGGCGGCGSKDQGSSSSSSSQGNCADGSSGDDAPDTAPYRFGSDVVDETVSTASSPSFSSTSTSSSSPPLLYLTARQVLWALQKIEEMPSPSLPSSSLSSSSLSSSSASEIDGRVVSPRDRAICAVVLTAIALSSAKKGTRRHGDGQSDGGGAEAGWFDAQAAVTETAKEWTAWETLKDNFARTVFSPGVDDDTSSEVMFLKRQSQPNLLLDMVPLLAISEHQPSISILAAKLFENQDGSMSKLAPRTAEKFLAFASVACTSGQNSAGALLFANALAFLGDKETQENKKTEDIAGCISEILFHTNLPDLICQPLWLTEKDCWGREQLLRRLHIKPTRGSVTLCQPPLTFLGDTTELAVGVGCAVAGARIVALDNVLVSSRSEIDRILLRLSTGEDKTNRWHTVIFKQPPTTANSLPWLHGSSHGAAHVLVEKWVGKDAVRAERAAELALEGGHHSDAGALIAVALHNLADKPSLDRLVQRFLSAGGGAAAAAAASGDGAAASSSGGKASLPLSSSVAVAAVRASCVVELARQDGKGNHRALKRVLKVAMLASSSNTAGEELSDEEVCACHALSVKNLRLQLAKPHKVRKGKDALVSAANTALALASKVGFGASTEVAEELKAALTAPSKLPNPLAISLPPDVAASSSSSSSPLFGKLRTSSPACAKEAAEEVSFRVGLLVAAATASSGGVAALLLLKAADSLPSLAAEHLLDSLETKNSQVKASCCRASFVASSVGATHSTAQLRACKQCVAVGNERVHWIRTCRCVLSLLGFPVVSSPYHHRLTLLVVKVASRFKGPLSTEIVTSCGDSGPLPLVLPEFGGLEQPVFDVHKLEQDVALVVPNPRRRQRQWQPKQQQQVANSAKEGSVISVQDAAAFCSSFFSAQPDLATAVREVVCENEIDGGVLASMTEVDLREVLAEGSGGAGGGGGDGGESALFSLSLGEVQGEAQVGAWLALRRLSLAVEALKAPLSAHPPPSPPLLVWPWIQARLSSADSSAVDDPLLLPVSSPVCVGLDTSVVLSLTEEELHALAFAPTSALSSVLLCDNSGSGTASGEGQADGAVAAVAAARRVGRALCLLRHLDPQKPGQQGFLANLLPHNSIAWATAEAEKSGEGAGRVEIGGGNRGEEDEEDARVSRLRTMVVLGNTGAGKSTLLNSLLGEAVLLPTNCMRACTATIIEMLHLSEAPCFAAASPRRFSSPDGAAAAAANLATAEPQDDVEETQPFVMSPEQDDDLGDDGDDEEGEEEEREARLRRFPYHASIQFINRGEWRRDVLAAIEDTRRAKASKLSSASASSSSSSSSAASNDDNDGEDDSSSGVSAEVMKLRSTLGAAEADRLLAAVFSGEAVVTELLSHPKVRPLLGTTKRLAAPDADALHSLLAPFVDSANGGENGNNGAVSGDGSDGGPSSSGYSVPGALWPLVGRVRVFGPWAVLAGGARLVDSPGLADDNSARDQVVKGYIRKADSVMLVSNIRRATNDKTVKDWLSPSLRRALIGCGKLSGQSSSAVGGGDGGGSSVAAVSAAGGGGGGSAGAGGSGAATAAQQEEEDGGRFGDLVFVVTQTDCVVRSEAIENLGLAEDTPLLQVARARNAFVKQKLTEDFFHGADWRCLPVNKAFLRTPSSSLPTGSALGGGRCCTFEDGIRKVLRQVTVQDSGGKSPILGLTTSALALIDLLLDDFCTRILTTCATSSSGSPSKSPAVKNVVAKNEDSIDDDINYDDSDDDDDDDLLVSVTSLCDAAVGRAVRELLHGTPELLKCALTYVEKQIADATTSGESGGVSTNSASSSSSSSSASTSNTSSINVTKLAFSTAVTEAKVAASPVCKRTFSPKAVVYLTAILEYMAAEWLELSGNAAVDLGTSLITPWCVLSATANDEELESLPSTSVLRAMDAAVAEATSHGGGGGKEGNEEEEKEEDEEEAEEGGSSGIGSSDEFQYPVFCVSSMDFQKATGVRGPEDGPPAVFRTDVRDTEVPALRAFIALASAQQHHHHRHRHSCDRSQRKKAGDVFISCHDSATGGGVAVSEFGGDDDDDDEGGTDDGAGRGAEEDDPKRQKTVDSGGKTAPGLSSSPSSSSSSLSLKSSSDLVPPQPPPSSMAAMGLKRLLPQQPEDARAEQLRQRVTPLAAAATTTAPAAAFEDDDDDDEVIDLT